jgi:hypothetical protein
LIDLLFISRLEISLIASTPMQRRRIYLIKENSK